MIIVRFIPTIPITSWDNGMQINNPSRQTVIHLRFIALKYREAAYRLAKRETRIGAWQGDIFLWSPWPSSPTLGA